MSQIESNRNVLAALVAGVVGRDVDVIFGLRSGGSVRGRVAALPVDPARDKACRERGVGVERSSLLAVVAEVEKPVPLEAVVSFARDGGPELWRGA